MNLSYVFNMNKFHGQYVEQNKLQKEAFSILVKVKKKKKGSNATFSLGIQMCIVKYKIHGHDGH